MNEEKNEETIEEEIKPYTQKEVPQKKSYFGLITIASSVILGLSFLGGSYLLTQNYKESNPDKITEVSKEDEVDGFDKAFLSQVNPTTFTSLEDVVVDRTQSPFSDGYVADSENLTYLNGRNAQKLFDNKESFLLYVGRPNCPYCHEFRKSQDKALEELGMTIYSIDSIFAKYDLKLKDIMQNVLEVEYVPAVFVIENGEVKGNLFDDLKEDEAYNYEKVKGWFETNKI